MFIDTGSGASAMIENRPAPSGIDVEQPMLLLRFLDERSIDINVMSGMQGMAPNQNRFRSAAPAY